MKRNLLMVAGCMILIGCSGADPLEPGAVDAPVVEPTLVESGQVSTADEPDTSDADAIDTDSTPDADLAEDGSATVDEPDGEDDATTLATTTVVASSSASTATTSAPVETSSTATTSAPVETSTTEAEANASDTGATVADNADADTSNADDELDISVSEIVSEIGVPFDEQLQQCLTGKGIAVDLPLNDEESVISAAQDVLRCAPGKAAEAQAQSADLPEGVSKNDFECAAAELNAYFAGLSSQEGIEFVFDDAAGRNRTLRESVGQTAQKNCDLSEEQVIAIIGVSWLT